MTYANQAFPVLWNTIVDGIQNFILHDIAQFAQFLYNEVEIPFVPAENVGNVFKQKNFWADAPDSVYENGKAVAGVFHAFLASETTEWLAWGSAYDNANFVCFWIIIANFKKLLVACTHKVLVVSIYSRINHFETNRSKTSCFEA